MKTIQIPHNFVPRFYQLPLFEKFEEGYKRFLIIAHRRSGKDCSALNLLIRAAVQNVGVYLHILPSYAQAKKVIWDSITNDGQRIIDYFPQDIIENKNNQEMKIRLKNGSLFQLVGSDNYDTLMGTNPKGVVFSEYALQDPRAYEFIRPILTANKGWAVFISTPRGKNHLWDLYRIALKNPEWWVQVLTIKDTGIITEEDIERDRREGMSEEIIQQEYYCSFDRGVDGSYYGKIMSNLRDQNRIRKLFYDEYAQVHTAWDLGFHDSTVIWFYQLIAHEVHLIDYYEAHGEGLAHYMKILDKYRIEKNYLYGSHYVPHDATCGSPQTGVNYIKYALEFGVRLIALRREGVDIGIERVRRWLPKCFFDEKNCDKGIKALENYQKTFNDKLKVYSENPLHNWASHASDALRYLCQSVDMYQSGASLELDEYRKMKQQYGIVSHHEFTSNSGNASYL